MNSYAPPPTIRDLWPIPPLGDWARRDMQRPIPVAGGNGFQLDNDNLPQREITADEIADTGMGQPIDPSISQAISGHYVPRGVDQQGAYQFQTFNNRMSPVVTHSLAREILYNWADAQFNIGGGAGYPLDYGFGPGAHGDCLTPQIYMKPGIYRNQRASKPPIQMGIVGLSSTLSRGTG